MPDRLEQLETMLRKNPDDAFLLYAIAMEHKKLGNNVTALEYLGAVIRIEPGHGYAFFQRGQIFESTGDLTSAKTEYEQGILAAQKSGDAHARSELQGALDQL